MCFQTCKAEQDLLKTRGTIYTGTQLLIVIIDATWNVNACYCEVSYASTPLYVPVNFMKH